MSSKKPSDHEKLSEEPVMSEKDSLGSPLSFAPGQEGYVDEGKLLRRIDFHVLPILWVIYVAAFLDRANISNALTLGLPEELGLGSQQVSIMLAIFFVPYTIFEIPSNILMKKCHPHNWLTACILTFGFVTIGQGLVKNYIGLVVARFFLGVSEAGVFPGCLYLISFWYKREEAQKRFTIFYTSTIISATFGSLLASAIAKLDDARGLSSWRWIFIIEGIATIIIACIAFFSITDFPKEAKWLFPDERAFILAKTKSHEPHSVPITLKDMRSFLSKPRHLVGGMMFFTLSIPFNVFAYYLPTIVQSLGYGPVQTQLHSVPPAATGLGFSIVLAHLSDRFRVRSLPTFVSLALLIAGLSLLTAIPSGSNFSTEYAALCLISMGICGGSTIIICWWVMNLRGHAERSIGSGWLISLGSIGGIIAAFTFKRDAEFYHKGYIIGLSLSFASVVVCGSYAGLIWRTRKAEARSGGTAGVKLDPLWL